MQLVEYRCCGLLTTDIFFSTEITDQVDSVANASGYTGFESRTKHRLSWGFSWFFSVS